MIDTMPAWFWIPAAIILWSSWAVLKVREARKG